MSTKIDSIRASFVWTLMFTRHLYESDEVIAALQWSIRKGRTRDAVFWCLELLDSEMETTVLEELYTVWLWYVGIGNLSGALQYANLDTKEDILSFVCGLSRLSMKAHDRSVLVLLLYGSRDLEQPDRANGFPCLEHLFNTLQCSDLEKAFANAVYQGKARLAFDLSRALWTSPRRVYELLDQIQLIKHKGSLSDHLTLFELNEGRCQWPIRACAIASICLDNKRRIESLKPLNLTIPSEIRTDIEEWTQLIGRRNRRILAIPYECLYYGTKRGRMQNKETTLNELCSLSHETLGGCPFWNRVLDDEVPWLDDDRKEALYDLYFPDDIPDEWSRQDQEKSHGYGSLINTELPNYQKYIDRWVRQIPSRSSWLPTRDLLKLCTEETVWSKAFDKPWDDIVSTWCLTPVKKRLLVSIHQDA